MRRRTEGNVAGVREYRSALAAPALAAPADEEYLPKVPKAAGDEVVAGEGEGSTILSPKARGAEDGRRRGRGRGAKQSVPWPEARTTTSGPADTLLDPIVLLLIAGVIAAAVGMTLKRRQGSDD